MTAAPPLARHLAQRARAAWPLPDEVRHAAERSMLDTVGAMLAGRRHPLLPRLQNALCNHRGRAPLVTGGTADADTAARINCAAAHAWDVDDTCYTGIQHASAVILPALLALGAERGTPPETLLRAFVAGSEVAYELGAICTNRHYFAGWWATTTLGMIGAVAGLGVLAGLDEDQLTHALGTAATTTSGLKAAFGSDAKPALVGDTCARAITIVRMAEAGVTGPEDGFEGPTGFLAMHGAAPAQPYPAPVWRLVEDGVLIKAHPVCSAAQAAIEAVGTLMSEAGLTASDIERVDIATSELVRISLVHDRPVTPQQAQFSMPYAVACALRHGAVRFEDLTPEALTDPACAEVMDRVHWRALHEFDRPNAADTAPEPARVTLTDTAGRTHTGTCLAAYGMPTRPMSDADLITKFETAATFAAVAINETRINGFDPLAVLRAAASDA